MPQVYHSSSNIRQRHWAHTIWKFFEFSINSPPCNNCLMQLSKITARMKSFISVSNFFNLLLFFFSRSKRVKWFYRTQNCIHYGLALTIVIWAYALEVNKKVGRQSLLEDSKGICSSPVDNRAPSHLLGFTKHLKCKFK